jgi:penicillin amidase
MTSAVADASDLFVEKTHPEDPNLVMAPDQTWEAIESVPVVIGYRDGQGMAQKTLSYRRTRNGPLVQDLFPGLLPDRAPPVALRWELRGVGGSFPAFLAAARARNVHELREALAPHVAPIVVITAADVEGSLAHFAVGRIPTRDRHLGTFPVPGWKPEYQWSRYVPASDMPAGTGGADDAFVGANNLLIRPGTGTHPVQAESAPPYRWQRIVERLDSLDSHDIASFSDIHGDTVVLRARRVAPILIQDLVAYRFDDPVEVAAIDLLRKWDHDATADSGGAAVFFTTWREAVAEALRDEADGPGFFQVLTDGYGTARYDDWFDDPDHPVWDDRETPATERRTDVTRKAFEKSVSVLRESLGKNPDKWRWGALHRRKPTHPFGTRSGLGMFNLPESDGPGGLDSVWKATFARTSGDYRIVSGPAYRMIVDLGEPKSGRWIIDTGVSGWPKSPHYSDQYELWRRNKTIPMHFDRESVAAAAKAILKLAGQESATQ